MQPAPPCSPSCLLVADSSIWATSLGVAIRHVICGFYLFICLFFFPVMLSPEIPKLPTDLPVRGCLETSPLSQLPPRDGSPVPNSFVSLFIFYILSYLLLKTMGYFYECLMSSASIQKLFCGICSAFKCSFNEFVKEKVVSLSYSSPS